MKGALGRGHGALDELDHGKHIVQVTDVLRLKSSGFELPHAAETPKVLRYFVDQDFFGGVGGLMLGAERSAELFELGGIFGSEDELLGIEAVLEGVLARSGFALGSPGPGGVLGVSTIDPGADTFGRGGLR